MAGTVRVFGQASLPLVGMPRYAQTLLVCLGLPLGLRLSNQPIAAVLICVSFLQVLDRNALAFLVGFGLSA